mgnify:CR=1 FL=1
MAKTGLPVLEENLLGHPVNSYFALVRHRFAQVMPNEYLKLDC